MIKWLSISICFQNVEQVEVVKEVVLPEISKLNEAVMNKSHWDQTEKKTLKKENGFGNICIFAVCYHTDKQPSEQYIISMICKFHVYM